MPKDWTELDTLDWMCWKKPLQVSTHESKMMMCKPLSSFKLPQRVMAWPTIILENEKKKTPPPNHGIFETAAGRTIQSGQCPQEFFLTFDFFRLRWHSTRKRGLTWFWLFLSSFKTKLFGCCTSEEKNSGHTGIAFCFHDLQAKQVQSKSHNIVCKKYIHVYTYTLPPLSINDWSYRSVSKLGILLYPAVFWGGHSFFEARKLWINHRPTHFASSRGYSLVFGGW